MSFPGTFSRSNANPSKNPSTSNNIQSDIVEDPKENENDENDDNDDDNEDEIVEEDQEENDDDKNVENKEDSQTMQKSGQEGQSKLEKVFIFLRSGFSWRPIPTINSTVSCLVITGVLFIVIGIIILVFSKSIKEIEIRYDDKVNCTIGSSCEINFKINETMKKNVFVYYRLKNLYQNHRRYIKSKSNKQLKGEFLTEQDIKDDCDPIILNKDLYEGITSFMSQQNNKTELDPNEVAHPCGLIAKSLFNDTFKLEKKDEGDIHILEEDIAWSIDKKKYKNSPNPEKQWTNVESERFMVWMRPAALPDFRKPWGKIDKDLTKGNYILTIENNYPVKSFDGEKYFILSTVNALGGKNYFLAILYFIVGGISLLAGIMFWFGYKKYNSDTEKTEKKD